MTQRSLPCLMIGLMTMSAQSTSGGEPERPTRQQTKRLDTKVSVAMDYLLYLPDDYQRKAPWPLVLFLHGAGERGNDPRLVKKHGPPKLIEQGQQFPMIVVSPQCPQEQWWQPIELTALLDEIVEKYNVDERRLYVTGLSMGGFGTWSLAAYAPHRFAAIAPICGGGEPFWAGRFAHLPTWVFHGGKDGVVPPRRSEEMVKALEEVGGDVKLTVYPEAGHDSWTQTYDNPQLYDWLLNQKRTETSGE
ncbi:MAG: prolyl oligopeptidase family serine peptidase [Planctomycetota bacterium]